MNGKCIIAFGLGAAVGSVASWYFLKTKYEQLAQEEIDSVKKVFSKREQSDKNESKIEESDDEEEPEKEKNKDFIKYVSKVTEMGYTNYSNIEMPLNDVKVDNDAIKNNDVEKPYVITPDEFSENYDYETITLIYYADHILTDDLDEPIEDVEDVVGFESLTHFGEYEDDSVYVRNDRLRVDYEILLDTRKYTDILKRKPYKGGLYDEERTQ